MAVSTTGRTADAHILNAPEYISGTNAVLESKINCTTENGITRSELYIVSGQNSELVNTQQFYNPGLQPPNPPSPKAGCKLKIDSTHWPHGTSISFKWRVKFLVGSGPEETEWTEFTCEEHPQVYNMAAVFINSNAAYDAAGTYSSLNTSYAQMNYSVFGQNSTTWTKADFTSALVIATSSVIETHGLRYNSGVGYLIPPFEGEAHHIDTADVQWSRFLSLFLGLPQMTDAATLACDAAGDAGMLTAYLADGNGQNQMSIGFSYSIKNKSAEKFRKKYMQMLAQGYTADAAIDAAVSETWPGLEPIGGLSVRQQMVSEFGDVNQRSHGLYGGSITESRLSVWFEVLP